MGGVGLTVSELFGLEKGQKFFFFLTFFSILWRHSWGRQRPPWRHILWGGRPPWDLTTLGWAGYTGPALWNTGPITPKKRPFFFFFRNFRFWWRHSSVTRRPNDVIWVSLESPFRQLSFPILRSNRVPRVVENGQIYWKMTSFVKKSLSFKKIVSKILPTQSEHILSKVNPLVI